MMRLRNLVHCLLSLSLLASVTVLSAAAQKEAIPDALKPPPPVVDPKTPPARDFHDNRFGISFRVPAGWNVTTKDRDVSTFRLDARTAPKAAQMRVVASIGFNPLPRSTFSGALFYVSVMPWPKANQCRGYGAGVRTMEMKNGLNGMWFDTGHDEHGGICTESRDNIYVTDHKGVCYRFDLVVNNFCGGDVSGVRDMTQIELDSIEKRLGEILDSVKLDGK